MTNTRKIKVNVISHDGKFIEVIERIPFHRGFVGNFVPVYVRYKGKEYFLEGGWDYAYMHGTPERAWITLKKGEVHEQGSSSNF